MRPGPRASADAVQFVALPLVRALIPRACEGRVRMSVLHSAEIRWILKGPVPDRVTSWFGAVLGDVEDRVDLYLVFPGCESVGLKIRNAGEQSGSKMEVKALRSSPEVVGFAAEMIGRADAWVKWTHSTNDVPDWVRSVVDAESTWVEMRKQRRLRRYSLETGQPVVIGDERVNCGCSVELVEISVKGDTDWWTFGFESWGAPHDVRTHLRTTALSWIAEMGPPPQRLQAIDSLSYPTWTAGLVGPTTPLPS